MIDASKIFLTYKLDSSNNRSFKEYIIRCIKRKHTTNSFDVLKNVTFHVNKGEVVGIIGENGAGKSTLLKVISKILKPTGGTLTTNGKIIPLLELGCGFDIELTGRENIYLNGAILGYSKEYINSKYDEIVSFSELGEFINQPVRTYSSGMTMRLGFSIATICNPEILIVDEILAVGDDKFQVKSLNKMLELMTSGTTVLFVSHNIDLVKRICNKVLWLEHGAVKMFGDSTSVCDAYIKRGS